MKRLTIETFAALVRTGSVNRVFLVHYPAIDGGGWCIDIDHNDLEQTRSLNTKRGWLRLFKTADAAMRALKKCGYVGPVNVVTQRNEN